MTRRRFSEPVIWRTLQTPGGHRPTTRDEQREARLYAECWYQALREWRIASYDVARPASSGRGTAVLLTSGSVGPLEVNYLRTPLGREVGEVTVARTITTWEVSHIPAQRQHGDLLGRVVKGQALASLIDSRGGWASPKERAVSYAVAVLTLAVSLRDSKAETHLARLQKSGD